MVEINPGSNEIKKNMIMLWHGTIADIPEGWHLCDGQMGTLDLRDKFIVGAAVDDGGVAKANIEADPGMNPSLSGGTNNHAHGATLSVSVNQDMGTDVDIQSSGGTYAATAQGSATGTVDYSNSLPPYYAVAYIERLG